MNKKSLSKDVERLLPWYINGTLNEAETDRVAAALEATENASKLLDAEVELSQRLVETPPALEQILKQRARSYESLRGNLTGAPGRVLGRHPIQQPARSWLVAALSIGVVAAIASIGWWSTPAPHSNEYSTLSKTEPPGTAVIVQVMVKEDVSRQQTQRLADHLHASVASGPSPRNVYKFALPTQSQPGADLQWIRDQPEVVFADIQAP